MVRYLLAASGMVLVACAPSAKFIATGAAPARAPIAGPVELRVVAPPTSGGCQQLGVLEIMGGDEAARLSTAEKEAARHGGNVLVPLSSRSTTRSAQGVPLRGVVVRATTNGGETVSLHRMEAARRNARWLAPVLNAIDRFRLLHCARG